MDQPFTAASHHDVLVLLVQLAVLLLTARLMGEVAQCLGQPTVVGEILAGIVLGPSLLSGFIPALGEWIVPQTPTQGYLLETVSLMGVMFLLLITGLETDLMLIRQQARSAIGVAIGGLGLPLTMGFLLGMLLPDDMLVNPDARIVFSLFLATAMSISAIPVVAKVLMDLRLTRRNIGQTIIAAAMIDDTTGWVLLSIVIALAGGAAITVGTVAQSVLSVLAFMVLSFTVGQWFIRRASHFVQNNMTIRDRMLWLVVSMMFVWGVIGQALGLEALLGAFVLGILFSRIRNLSVDVIHKLESIALSIFAPIFFAVAGLKVNAQALLEPRLLVIGLIVLGVATFCKIVGVYFGARWIGGSDHWTALFFGAGLNARGSMEIIVATIGLSLGVLTQDMFSIIVVMAVTTSLMAPFLLRWTLSHIIPEQQELDRLRREELNRDNMIANVHRVLLPVRRRENQEHGVVQTIESVILDRISRKTDLEVTLFNVTSDPNDTRSSEFLTSLSKQFAGQALTRKVVRGDNAQDLILRELHKDYDLLIMGASERQRASNVLFTPLVDHLVRLSPCPTLIVHGERVQADWQPQRILVPTNGTTAARRAAEVAFALALDDNEVHILNVIQQNGRRYFPDARGEMTERQRSVAEQFVNQLRELGQAQDVQTFGDVRGGDEIESTVLDYARDHNINLIVLGTSVHFASDRLYLGPRVERILNNAPCPVLIINSP